MAMPVRTVQRRLAGSVDVATLMVSVRADASMDLAKEQITWLMRERRHIGPGDNDDFSVMDTRQIAETLFSTTKVAVLSFMIPPPLPAAPVAVLLEMVVPFCTVNVPLRLNSPPPP